MGVIYIFTGGAPHLKRFFYQCVNVLYRELLDMGFKAVMVDDLNQGNPLNRDLYIIFCSHDFLYPIADMKVQRILFHSEQLGWDNFFPILFPYYKQTGVTVWCHSQYDANLLKSKGVPAFHMPFGYSNYYSVLGRGDIEGKFNSDKAIFLASSFGLTERRLSAMRNIPQIKLVSECWDVEAYRKLVGEEYLFVNIDKYPDPRYTCSLRIFPLICNLCLVLSEKTDDTPEVMNRISVIYSGEDDLKEKIKLFTENKEMAKAMIEEKYNWIKANYYFGKIFKENGCYDNVMSFIGEK
jgi:hypothetical protein